ITIAREAVRECKESQMCQCISHSRLTEVRFARQESRRVGWAAPQLVRGEMSMRLTLIVAAMAAACAGAALMSAASVRAETECLGAPKGASPEGRHWYYRADKSTGKRCWYLGQKIKKTRQASSSPAPSRRSEVEPAEAPTIVAEAPTIVAAADGPPA